MSNKNKIALLNKSLAIFYIYTFITYYGGPQKSSLGSSLLAAHNVKRKTTARKTIGLSGNVETKFQICNNHINTSFLGTLNYIIRVTDF
jgi:hypothetical protein